MIYNKKFLFVFVFFQFLELLASSNLNLHKKKISFKNKINILIFCLKNNKIEKKESILGQFIKNEKESNFFRLYPLLITFIYNSIFYLASNTIFKNKYSKILYANTILVFFRSLIPGIIENYKVLKIYNDNENKQIFKGEMVNFFIKNLPYVDKNQLLKIEDILKEKNFASLIFKREDSNYFKLSLNGTSINLKFSNFMHLIFHSLVPFKCIKENETSNKIVENIEKFKNYNIEKIIFKEFDWNGELCNESRKEYGIILRSKILFKNESDPFCLTGYSYGGEIILNCIEELIKVEKKNNLKSVYINENIIILIGTPLTARTKEIIKNYLKLNEKNKILFVSFVNDPVVVSDISNRDESTFFKKLLNSGKNATSLNHIEYFLNNYKDQTISIIKNVYHENYNISDDQYLYFFFIKHLKQKYYGQHLNEEILKNKLLENVKNYYNFN